ncbi:hypothetical protein BHE74_00049256, partial [Ensete ventricosum]
MGDTYRYADRPLSGEYLASAVLARLPSSPASRLRVVAAARGSPACRRRSSVDRGRFFSRARRRSVSPREETDRGD